MMQLKRNDKEATIGWPGEMDTDAAELERWDDVCRRSRTCQKLTVDRQARVSAEKIDWVHCSSTGGWQVSTAWKCRRCRCKTALIIWKSSARFYWYLHWTGIGACLDKRVQSLYIFPFDREKISDVKSIQSSCHIGLLIKMRRNLPASLWHVILDTGRYRSFRGEKGGCHVTLQRRAAKGWHHCRRSW